MSEPIKKTDVIEEGILLNIIKESKELLPIIEKNNTALSEMAVNFEKLSSAENKTLAGLLKTIKAFEDSEKLVDKKNKLEEDSVKLKERLKAAEEQLAKTREENKKKTKELTEEELKLRLESQEARKVMVDKIKTEKAQIGSIERLNLENKKLRKEVRNLNLETEEGRKKAAEINAVIDKNTAIIKENVDKRIQQTMTVGDYKTAITDALGQTGIFNAETQKLTAIFRSVTTIMKTSTVATNGFKAALVSTGVGALIIALGSVIAFLTSTQEGMDKVSVAMAGVSNYIQVWIDSFAKLGGQILDSLMPILKGLGDVLAGIFTFDFDRVSKGFEDIGKAVDNIDPLNIIKINEEATKSAKAAADLKQQLILLERAEYRYGVTIAKNQIIKDEALLNAKDETIEIHERVKALDLAKKLVIEEANAKIKFAKERLRIERELNKLTYSPEEALRRELEIEKEILQLEAQRYSELKTFQRDDLRLKREIEQQQLNAVKNLQDLQKKQIDKLLLNIKSNNEAELIELENHLKKLDAKEVEEIAKTQEKIRQLKIKFIEQERDFLLQNTEITEGERRKIIAESESKILDLTLKNKAIEETVVKTKLERFQEYYKNFSSIVQDTYSKITNIIKDQDDREAQMMDSRIDRQQQAIQFEQDLAARGMKSNLALEKENLAKMEAERERFEIQRRRREKRNLIAQTYLKLIENTNPLEAVVKAIAIVQGLTGYAKGTKNAEEGVHMMFEEGSEIWTDKHGKIKEVGSNQGTQFRYTKAGDQVLNNKETREALKGLEVKNGKVQAPTYHQNSTEKTVINKISISADIDSFGNVIFHLADQVNGKNTSTKMLKTHRI